MRGIGIRGGVLAGVLLGIGGLWWQSLPTGTAVAQTVKKPAPKGTAPGSSRLKTPLANTQPLDVKGDQVLALFIKDMEDLAEQYVDAGHIDKAKGVLETVLAVKPGSASTREKLKQLDETLLTANTFTAEVDPSQSWESTKVLVFEGKPIRIQATGSYRMVLNSAVDANGIPDKDLNRDMVAGLPCGALVGVILKEKSPGKPFVIGEGKDFTPKETGLLFLRVNTPPDNKNTGRLKVTISGYVKST